MVLGTSYPDMVADISALIEQLPELPGAGPDPRYGWTRVALAVASWT